jgi:myo-inositol-1-phosphate synthase
LGKLRVAIVGVGNCASSLVQGVGFYRDADPASLVPGLMHVDLGGYHVGDIELVAAFDVGRPKVGHDLAEAVLAPPNNTLLFHTPEPTGVIVQRGPTLDGLGHSLSGMVEESDALPVDVAKVLRRAGCEIVVSYLPVGAERATRYYAEQALVAGCGLVNCIPVFIASDPAWQARFAEANLPLIGDDVKSQVGATITHRLLANLFRERGVRLDRTYQLNFGGNTDFLNMLDRDRLESKKLSKTRAVTSQFAEILPDSATHVGPSDHVPWLTDRKIAYIRLEGTAFGNAPLSCELKLEVWDSPNSAGVVIDGLRCAKLALDRGIGGVLPGPSSWLMKSPPRQVTDAEAHDWIEAFIRGEVER